VANISENGVSLNCRTPDDPVMIIEKASAIPGVSLTDHAGFPITTS